MGKTRESANLVSKYNVFSDTSNSRIGIATSSPQYSLDIVGDLNFTGNLNQGGSTFVASRWTSGIGDDIYRLNGDVGIGTTNPDHLLSIHGDSTQLQVSGFTSRIRVNRPSDSGTNGFDFQTNGLFDWAFGSVSAGSSDLYYRSRNDGSTLDVLTLKYLGGNVGINSTNPGSKLSVGGSITELYQGEYWNVVTQADIGIGASQVPLNQYLGQLAFLDEYGNSITQNPQTAAYTLVRDDNGKHISITTGGVTIPSGVFEVGDSVSIYNNSGSSQTITQGASVTLRLAGTATTGNRTLGQYGLCSILCVASNTFVISGAGLS